MQMSKIGNSFKMLGLASLISLSHCTNAPKETGGDKLVKLIKNFESGDRFTKQINGETYYQVYYGAADKLADLKKNKIHKKGNKLKKLLTVGHGHSQRGFIELSGGKKIREGDLITNKQADSLLKADMQEKQKILETLIKKPLSDNEKNAVSSYIFNIQWKTLASDSDKKKPKKSFFECINEGQKALVQAKFNIVTAGGIVHQGLIKRRIIEMAIFGNGEIYNDPQAKKSFTNLVKKLNPKSGKSSINEISDILTDYGIESQKVEKLKTDMLNIFKNKKRN